MRTVRICTLLSSIFILLAMTHPLPASAANQVGLYLEQDGSGPLGSTALNVPFTVYLVLTDPVDPSGTTSTVQAAVGFELSILFEPAPVHHLQLQNVILAEDALDIGISRDVSTGAIDFAVGIPIGKGPKVIDGAVVLAELQFLALGSDPVTATLVPLRAIQSIPGEMCYVSDGPFPNDNTIVPMRAINGDGVDFEFNGVALAAESRTFGSVKALFR